MAKDILLLQFRKNEEVAHFEKEFVIRDLGIFADQIKTINFFKEKPSISKKELVVFNGVVIGGCAEFSFSQKEKTPVLWEEVQQSFSIVRALMEEHIPILGICLGHQLLGYLLGSQIIRDPAQQEIGTFTIFLTPEGKKDPLFKGLPDSFAVQHGHKDSIEKLPDGAVLLAEGKRGKISSFKYGTNYGVQFHPEIKPEDFKTRLDYAPEYNVENLEIKPSPHTPKILKNFYDHLTL